MSLFFGSLFLGLIFVFVKDLGWEHEKGHVRTREDGNMESECGTRSDVFVVVCFQKGIGLWGWKHGFGRLRTARRWKCVTIFVAVFCQNKFLLGMGAWSWEPGYGSVETGVWRFFLVVFVNKKYFLIKKRQFFLVVCVKKIFDQMISFLTSYAAATIDRVAIAAFTAATAAVAVAAITVSAIAFPAFVGHVSANF